MPWPALWLAARAMFPSAQAANQLTLESIAALNVERLVDGFVGDAHGFVIREVELQPVGNLFG